MFSKIIKIFIKVVILVLCGLIILRCCASGDRSSYTDLLVTPEMSAAYVNGTLEVLKLEEDASEITTDGYFSAYGFRYVPETKQLQVTVRWNVSTWDYLNLPEGTEMDFYLCCNDDTSTFRVPDVVESYEKSLYQYRVLQWNDVEIGEDNWQVYMDRQDGEYSVAAIRYMEQEYRTYKLSSGEKKALQGK